MFLVTKIIHELSASGFRSNICRGSDAEPHCSGERGMVRPARELFLAWVSGQFRDKAARPRMVSLQASMKPHSKQHWFCNTKASCIREAEAMIIQRRGRDSELRAEKRPDTSRNAPPRSPQEEKPKLTAHPSSLLSYFQHTHSSIHKQHLTNPSI